VRCGGEHFFDSDSKTTVKRREGIAVPETMCLLLPIFQPGTVFAL